MRKWIGWHYARGQTLYSVKFIGKFKKKKKIVIILSIFRFKILWLLVMNNYAQFMQKSVTLLQKFVLYSFKCYLQQQLDPLDRSHGCFGNRSSNTTGQKVLHETNHTVRHGWMLHLYCANPQNGPHGNPTPLQVSEDSSGSPNISTPFIARILSDGFGFSQTAKQD